LFKEKPNSQKVVSFSSVISLDWRAHSIACLPRPPAAGVCCVRSFAGKAETFKGKKEKGICYKGLPQVKNWTGPSRPGKSLENVFLVREN